MPNAHRNKSIGWHPADSTLKPRLKAFTERLSITEREVLDKALVEFLDRNETIPPEEEK